MEIPEEIDMEVPQEIDMEIPEEIDMETPQEIDMELPEDIDMEATQEIDMEIPEETDVEAPQEIDMQPEEQMDMNENITDQMPTVFDASLGGTPSYDSVNNGGIMHEQFHNTADNSVESKNIAENEGCNASSDSSSTTSLWMASILLLGVRIRKKFSLQK